MPSPASYATSRATHRAPAGAEGANRATPGRSEIGHAWSASTGLAKKDWAARKRRPVLWSLLLLGRRSRPRFDQSVVVDGLRLRFLVRELGLWSDIAISQGLFEPVLRCFLLVQLRTARALDARPFQTSEYFILGCRERIHRLLRRLRA